MGKSASRRQRDRMCDAALGYFCATSFGLAMVAGAGCGHNSNGAAADARDAATSTGESPIDTGAALVDADAVQDADLEACHPGTISGFQPAAFVASHPSDVCNGFNGEGGLVEAYGHACIGHAKSYDACAAFAVPDAGAAAACYDCLTSPLRADASSYGAVVVVGIPFVNYSGCIQLIDPDGGTSCSHALTAASTCNEYACRSTCPTSEYPSFDLFQSCWDEATSGVCGGYWLPVQSCVTAEQGDGSTPVGKTCFPGTVEDNYRSVARLLCGGE